MNFTKRKLLSFTQEKQHKKCAELLRELYEDPTEELLQHYNEIQQWMGNTIITLSKREISDRYHNHLRKAKVSLREHNLLPTIRKRDKIKSDCDPLPIAIYLDQIRSAHNVGSILRSVEAFALGSVYFSSDTPFIDHQQVRNTSMGTHQHIECFRSIPLQQLPRPLIALETSNQSIVLHEFIFPETFTLVLGNEEYGCSEEVLSQTDYLLEIPLRGRKNSLNVANAFAIAAAEIVKQSTKQKNTLEIY